MHLLSFMVINCNLLPWRQLYKCTLENSDRTDIIRQCGSVVETYNLLYTVKCGQMAATLSAIMHLIAS